MQFVKRAWVYVCVCVCVCVKAVKCMPDLFRSDSNNVTKYEHEREGEGERS